jgi:NAD(P)-dependent dehydrogenase (short-subunit alcohol dehydrogenase family)
VNVRLAGKKAIVTGAGKGIGHGVALTLAREGADVAAFDISADVNAVAAQEISALGRRGIAVTVDVSRPEDIRRAVAKVVAEFGQIDILVNCAGIVTSHHFLDLTEEQWDSTLDTNAKGTFFINQIVAKEMIPHRSGSIINITSGVRARPMATHYAASKVAVDIITKSAALTLAPHNIRVNAIDPGMVDTPMWREMDAERVRLFGLAPGEATRRWIAAVPLGRMSTPDEVAKVVVFLASDDASYVTGAILSANGGLDLATLEKTQDSSSSSTPAKTSR